MKDCAFQYATGCGEVLENTDLVTRADAEELWQKYVPIFKQHLQQGREPEMAIWIDMGSNEDYHTTAVHWDARDMILVDNILYSRVE